MNYGKKFFHKIISQHRPLHSDYDEFEPLPDFHFIDNYEKHLQNVNIIKGVLYHYIKQNTIYFFRFYTYYI